VSQKGGTGSTWSHRTFESSAALTLTIPPKKEIRNNKSGTNHFLAQSFAATYDIQPASANGKNREGKANSVQRTPSPHTCQCIIAQYCAYRILPQFAPQPHFVITRRTFPGRKNCSYKSPHYSYHTSLTFVNTTAIAHTKILRLRPTFCMHSMQYQLCSQVPENYE